MTRGFIPIPSFFFFKIKVDFNSERRRSELGLWYKE